MKISVVIPVYKVEAYLCKCVDSVLMQSYKDIEIILVDDGSPDNSPSICDDYAIRDSRVKVIHKTNGGLSDARNHGIKASTGDYLMFLDSDDWWSHPEAVSQIVEVLKNTKSDVLVYRMKKYFQNIHKYADVSSYGINADISMEEMMRRNIFVASACDKVVKKSLIDRFELKFVKGQLSEDIEWSLSLLVLSSKIVFLDEAFYIYRQQNASSISSNVTRKHLIDIKTIIEKYLQSDSENIRDNIYLQHFLANQYILWLTNSSRVKNEDVSDLKMEMKRFWSIIRFNWYPYVHMVSKYRIFGYSIVCKLLAIYVKYRHK